MNNFYIVTNKQKDKDNLVTNRIRSFLQNHGKRVCKSPDDEVDCVISLGGDGTLIQAACEMADKDAAFVGVNLGTVGFLTDVECSSLEESLERLVSGDYEIEERMMLKCSMGDQVKSLALNDVVLSRTGPIQVIEYSVYVNDILLTSYRADGIIISTPTGSTGYNLSAGGPIVEPSSRLILITPVSAHTLNSRSVILSDKDVVRVQVSWKRADGGAVLCCDGQYNVEMEAGDSVDISASSRTTKLVKFNRESFVTVLSRKLNR